MSNTDRDSMLERWADGMERLEQYYEGIYGPPATPPSLPPITTYDAMLEAIADGMERAKRNINKKSPTYHSDSVAYVKTVPAGNVHYASLEQIGGRTLAWNQLNNNNQSTSTVQDVTLTNNGDGSWTLNGTASANSSKWFSNTIKIVNGHKYYICGCPSGGGSSKYSLGFAGVGTDVGNGGVYLNTLTASTINLRFNFYNGCSFDNVTIYPKVVDLTLEFGAGYEPTADEFNAMFPNFINSNVPYNAGTLLSAGVTSVVSKKADTTELATYSIPAEVQALEGYGWSAGSVYNYIDFERKVFVQNVARVDLGTISYAKVVRTNYDEFQTAILRSLIKIDYTNPNIITTSYTPHAWSGKTVGDVALNSSGDVAFCVTTNQYADATAFKPTMNGQYLYYELATPIETDISAYLTDDNLLIEVEAGGSLTFPIQHGDDYRIPVPSSVTFVVGEP